MPLGTYAPWYPPTYVTTNNEGRPAWAVGLGYPPPILGTKVAKHGPEPERPVGPARAIHSYVVLGPGPWGHGWVTDDCTPSVLYFSIAVRTGAKSLKTELSWPIWGVSERPGGSVGHEVCIFRPKGAKMENHQTLTLFVPFQLNPSAT